jgi:hypothetical protein
LGSVPRIVTLLGAAPPFVPFESFVVSSAPLPKEVDADEATVRFWQEIYDERGQLVEVHEKYPLDSGHKKV